MTNTELEQMAQKSLAANEITHWSTGTSGFHKGFEACYRLLTTPRPMGEAPRDGTQVRVFLIGFTLDPVLLSYVTGYWINPFCKYSECQCAGWLPIFTPIEEDANG